MSGINQYAEQKTGAYGGESVTTWAQLPYKIYCHTIYECFFVLLWEDDILVKLMFCVQYMERAQF